MTPKYVVVTGSVGAGATTIAKVLLKHWNADELLEGEIDKNNPFFIDAQRDPARWMFANQAHFLAASAERHARLAGKLKTTGVDFVIEDRTPFEHQGAYVPSALALGDVSKRESILLGQLADEFEKGYLRPSLLFYREMSEDQIVERVISRARPGESIDENRLRTIHGAFERFARDWDQSKVIRIPGDLDVLTEEGEALFIAEASKHLGSPVR